MCVLVPEDALYCLLAQFYLRRAHCFLPALPSEFHFMHSSGASDLMQSLHLCISLQELYSIWPPVVAIVVIALAVSMIFFGVYDT